MGESTKIEWADHTFNCWIGCTRVSAACDFCYAERFGHRFGIEWGNNPRRLASDSTWRQPLAWNRAAQRDGVRRRVFCASLADVFDNQVDPAWRYRLWDLISDCRHLDWLLLTKRPQNIAKMLPSETQQALLPNGGPWPWPHVWLGTTTENQEEADRRISELLAVPAAKHFISAEPLLGPINGVLNYVRLFSGRFDDPPTPVLDWVIVGGESGPGARPMHPDWARSLRDQCQAAGVAFFMKQMTKKGIIPPDLFIREIPAA